MRLLYITPGFPAHERDYNCLPPLQALVRNLTAKGADVQIIALEYPFTKKTYNWHGAMVWPCNGRNKRWKKPLTIYRALNIAHRLSTEDQFDCLHSFWLTLPAEIADKVAEDWKIPHFTTLMGQDVLEAVNRSPKIKPERAPFLVTLSKYQNEVFEEVTGFAAENVIPWGVEIGNWKLEIERLKSAFENPSLQTPICNPQIIGVGSLLPIKNWHRWIHIVSLAIEQKPELQALIVGGGALEPELKKLVADLGLAENIRFSGELPRPEVMRLMSEANTLLHTSDFESFGMVLTEALANACRVVSTPVGIAPELPETFCSDEDDELADALLENLEKPRLEKPLVPFSMSDCGWAYWDLYHREFLK